MSGACVEGPGTCRLFFIFRFDKSAVSPPSWTTTDVLAWLGAVELAVVAVPFALNGICGALPLGVGLGESVIFLVESITSAFLSAVAA